MRSSAPLLWPAPGDGVAPAVLSAECSVGSTRARVLFQVEPYFQKSDELPS